MTVQLNELLENETIHVALICVQESLNILVSF